MNLKNIILYSLALIFSLVLGFLGYKQYYAKSPTEAYSKLTEKQLFEKLKKDGVPDFETLDLAQKKFHFAQLKGKKIILNFWASWCDPCVAEFPSLLKLLKKSKGELELVAISQDDSIENINSFLKAFPDRHQKNITVIWDKDHQLSRTFHVYKLPESFIIDEQGKMQGEKIAGSVDWSDPAVLQLINNSVQKK